MFILFLLCTILTSIWTDPLMISTLTRLMKVSLFDLYPDELYLQMGNQTRDNEQCRSMETHTGG